jgi:hypothetical protein
LKEYSSGWSELKVLRSARGLRELMLFGVLNFMPPKQSERRGEKMPLSSEVLRGVRGDGRNGWEEACPGANEPVLPPRFGVMRFVYSGEKDIGPISTSGTEFLSGVRKEESSRCRLLSCSLGGVVKEGDPGEDPSLPALLLEMVEIGMESLVFGTSLNFRLFLGVSSAELSSDSYPLPLPVASSTTVLTPSSNT